MCRGRCHPFVVGRSAEPAGGTTALEATELPSVPPPRGPIKQWEGLFHFAATVALTLELGRDYHAYAHVCPLPKSTDHKEWGNPDMIAVRESSWTLATSALADDDLEKALRLADTSPECIITSVELKSFDHPVSRKEWFAAISGNGSQLQVGQRGGSAVRISSLEPIDVPDEIKSLARDSGVGLYEIQFREDSELSVVKHVTHKSRPTIRLEQLASGEDKQSGLLKKIKEMLRSRQLTAPSPPLTLTLRNCARLCVVRFSTCPFRLASRGSSRLGRSWMTQRRHCTCSEASTSTRQTEPWALLMSQAR